MDELTAVQQLLADQPPTAPDVTIRARARLDRAMARTGVISPIRPAVGRQRRILVAAGVAVVVATGCVLAQMIVTGRTAPASALTVRELADRAAAAAARQPDVPGGQWVFWRERVGGPDCSVCGVFHVWTTADDQQAAWVYKGKVVDLGPGPFNGQPLPYLVRAGGYAFGAMTGKLPVSYAHLGSLPRSPQALDRYISRLHLPGWGPAPVREFSVIKLLLSSYVMPPGLTAEMYQALGLIPGIAVNNDAVDVAGRHGVGFISPAEDGGFHEMIILNPRTYRPMGYDQMDSPHTLSGGVAILRQELVSGPGKRDYPRACRC